MSASHSNPEIPRFLKRGLCGYFASIPLFQMGLALAAPGDLDPTFSGNGLLSLRPGNSEAQAIALTQQADGKLVLAGWSALNGDSSSDFMVARVAEDGTPDSTFGMGGFATVDYLGRQDFALDMVQQPDGKLVLAGTGRSIYDGDNIATVRFDSNGMLDASFSGDGIATFDDTGGDERAFALILRADGKLVIAGAFMLSDGGIRPYLSRLNADGTRDTTFAPYGRKYISFGDVSRFLPSDMVQQSDGKLVIVGTVQRNPLLTTTTVGIARVTASGEFDPSFAGDGRLVIGLEQGEGSGVAIQPDGAIVVAGFAVSSGGTGGAALIRVNSDGTMDNGFGTNGIAVVDLGDAGVLTSLVVEENGQLVATGARTTVGGGQMMVLTRFTSNGELDANFGVDGIATADFGTDFTAPESRGDALLRQIDGKYVSVGSCGLDSICAARFDDHAAFAGLVGLTATNQTVTETAGSVTYTVSRTGGKTGAISVNYATMAGSAQSGSDFEPASGTLTWNDGDAADKPVRVNLVNDDVPEADKDFLLTLSAPTGGAQLAASKATTTILSEDGPGELRFEGGRTLEVREGGAFGEPVVRYGVAVLRVNGSLGPVSVSYSTEDGTAESGTDFTAESRRLSWNDGDTTEKHVFVEILDDELREGPEEFAIQLSDPTGGATLTPLKAAKVVVIADDDAPAGAGGTLELVATAATVSEGGSLVLGVTRTGGSSGAVSVDYTTSPGTATAGADFTSKSGTLNWTDGDSTSKRIEVNVTNDTADESDETFTVTLSNPSAGATLGPDSTATITIADDDPPSGGGGTLEFVTTAATVSEDGSLVLGVMRTGGSSGAVSVDYATSSGTATMDTDFTSKSGTLNWADGDSGSTSIEVNVTNDTADESDESFTVILSNSSGAALGSNTTATVTITDDDSPSNGGGGAGDGGSGGGGRSDRLFLLSLLLLGLARKRMNGFDGLATAAMCSLSGSEDGCGVPAWPAHHRRL